MSCTKSLEDAMTNKTCLQGACSIVRKPCSQRLINMYKAKGEGRRKWLTLKVTRKNSLKMWCIKNHEQWNNVCECNRQRSKRMTLQRVVIAWPLSLGRDHREKRGKKKKFWARGLGTKAREVVRDNIWEVKLSSSPLGHHFQIGEELRGDSVSATQQRSAFGS